MVSVSFDALGWRPVPGSEGPGADSGPVAFIVVAPWCPDCRELAPRLRHWAGTLAATGGANPRVFLVGEFSSPEQTRAFSEEFGLTWPILAGTPEKSEACRERARFRDLREAWGDERRWGVPLWIEGRLRGGVLTATSVRWT